MEEAGIIKGYHTEINLAAVGLPMMAVMSLRTEGGSSGRIPALVQAMPEVLACHEVTGVECFYMRVAVASVEHLRQLIERLKVYGHVTTSLVLQSPVQRRTICPPDVEG
jgi:Lrp/AsnC family leucine-responsive transcriptional regulator